MKITKIEKQKNNEDRLNIFLDDEFAFGINQKLLRKFNLKKDKEINEEEKSKILEAEQADKALELAYRYLGYRPRSEQEIRDYLEKKEIDSKIIEKTVKKLKKQGQIDDREFVKSWINWRKNKRKGPYFIKNELYQKGVGKDLIEELLDKCYTKSEEKEIAQEAAQKKGLKSEMTYKQKGKIYRFLGQRGFSSDIIKEVIN